MPHHLPITQKRKVRWVRLIIALQFSLGSSRVWPFCQMQRNEQVGRWAQSHLASRHPSCHPSPYPKASSERDQVRSQQPAGMNLTCPSGSPLRDSTLTHPPLHQYTVLPCPPHSSSQEGNQLASPAWLTRAVLLGARPLVPKPSGALNAQGSQSVTPGSGAGKEARVLLSIWVSAAAQGEAGSCLL